MLCAAAGTSHAALTVYSTQASFLAVVANPGVNTFTDSKVTGSTPSPMARTAGAHRDDVLGLHDRWQCLRWQFFGSGITGNCAAGDVTRTGVDAMGAAFVLVITGATTASFLGFVCRGVLTTLTLSAVQTKEPRVTGAFFTSAARSHRCAGWDHATGMPWSPAGAPPVGRSADGMSVIP